MKTPSSLKQEKFLIIQNFDLSWSIIELNGEVWKPVSGPYMTKEEAQADLRIIECESE